MRFMGEPTTDMNGMRKLTLHEIETMRKKGLLLSHEDVKRRGWTDTQCELLPYAVRLYDKETGRRICMLWYLSDIERIEASIEFYKRAG